MKNQNGQKQKNTLVSFLGEPTKAKASGISFSFAAMLPTMLSVFFIAVLVVSGLAKQQDITTKDWYLYVSYLLPQISFAIVALFNLRYQKKPIKRAVAEQKCKPIYFLIATLLQIGLLALSQLNTCFLEFLKKFGYEDAGIRLPSMDGVGFVGVLFVVALLPAVFEEILFRGVLLQGLESFGKAGSVRLCGALFALYHQNPAQTVYQFCCGAAFALVALKSGSVLPTVLSHFLNNAAILILTKAGVTEYSPPVFIVIMIVSAVCLLLSLGYLLFMDKQEKTPMEKERAKVERKQFLLCALIGIAVCALSWGAVFVAGL